MFRKSIIIFLVLISGQVYAAAPSRPFNYVLSTVIDPSAVNSNENTLYSYLQMGVDTYLAGSISNASISPTAAISYSKLNLGGSILNSDIASGAGIIGSKLDLSSPGVIGGTSPAAGTFTALTANTSISDLGTLSVTGTLNVGVTHQGDIFYDNGSSIVRLVPGTSGQVLQTQGAAANPQWASGGALQFVSNTTVSGAATTGNITIDNTKHYKVRGILYPVSADDIMWLRFNNSANSKYAYVSVSTNAAIDSDTKIVLSGTVKSLATGTQDGYRFEFDIFPQGTDNTPQLTYTMIKGQAVYVSSANNIVQNSFSGLGCQATNTANTSFAILTAAGATFSGNVYLYQVGTS